MQIKYKNFVQLSSIAYPISLEFILLAVKLMLNFTPTPSDYIKHKF